MSLCCIGMGFNHGPELVAREKQAMGHVRYRGWLSFPSGLSNPLTAAACVDLGLVSATIPSAFAGRYANVLLFGYPLP